MKILIIDDSAFQRNQLKGMLDKNGYEVIEATDGGMGLEMIEKHRPDAVICDILMPRVDGFAFLKTLHSQKSTTPVIIISSNIQAPAKKLCMMYGAKAFLNKPITKEAVLEEVKKVLGESA